MSDPTGHYDDKDNNGDTESFGHEGTDYGSDDGQDNEGRNENDYDGSEYYSNPFIKSMVYKDQLRRRNGGKLSVIDCVKSALYGIGAGISAVLPEVSVVGLAMAVLGKKKGKKPKNLSPPGAKRRGAFRKAKRDAGIPVSQSPDRVGLNVDKSGNVQPGRTYEFDVPAKGGGKRTVTIREDSRGHSYGPEDPQNRGPHFNTEDGGHYDYD
jgi:hypothetical protein